MMAGGTSALVPSNVVGCERRRSRTSSRLPSRFFAVSSAQTAEETEELVPLVRVGFSIRVKVGYGDTVAIVGSSPGLGEWNVARALKLSWSQDADGCDIWTGMAPLPEHWVLRYKVRLWGLSARRLHSRSASIASHVRTLCRTRLGRRRRVAQLLLPR
jgi:hypothetical protein